MNVKRIVHPEIKIQICTEKKKIYYIFILPVCAHVYFKSKVSIELSKIYLTKLGKISNEISKCIMAS